jgi:uncharacterized membrane protein
VHGSGRIDQLQRQPPLPAPAHVVLGSERRSAKEDRMGFEQTMDAIARGVEIIGIVTLVLGLAAALVRAGLALTGGQGGEEAYRIVRTVFGRSILLGLEFLVAADIIRTVAVQPSLENVAVLGLIVLIRTFLSFSLEVEIDGRWPWQPAHRPGGAGTSSPPGDADQTVG